MFWTLVAVEASLAMVTAAALMMVTAPYGRHTRNGWGPTLPSRIGWIVMESPAVLVFLVASWGASGVAWVLFAMWQIHYLHRTFIFPFRTKSKRSMPAIVAAMAFAFNVLNATINGWWLRETTYHLSWLWDPRFIVGTLLFAAGMIINIASDNTLLRLRGPGESGYKVPGGGMYRFVSCPNYLGEIMEWVGFAIAAWSPAGAVFALYTMANLIPRAIQHHKWYQDTFPDYPKRRAVIPGLL